MDLRRDSYFAEEVLEQRKESTVARAMRGPVLLTMGPLAPPGGVGGDITASPVFVQF